MVGRKSYYKVFQVDCGLRIRPHNESGDDIPTCTSPAAVRRHSPRKCTDNDEEYVAMIMMMVAVRGSFWLPHAPPGSPLFLLVCLRGARRSQEEPCLAPAGSPWLLLA